MLIFEWKRLIPFILVAVACGVWLQLLPLRTATTSANLFLAEREPDPDMVTVAETEQDTAPNDAPENNQEPTRRALPAPLDGIFPRTDYLGPTPLIGVPDTDPVYPLTKALWTIVPALKNGRIRVYGWEV